MPALAPVPPMAEVTIALHELVPHAYRHYFNGRPDRPHYQSRRYDFGSSPLLMPLVRAFLDTCAAERGSDYRYLFTLLGSELAGNALRHSRSGLPGRSYTLLCRRRREGLRLVCRDGGVDTGRRFGIRDRRYLTVDPGGLDPEAEAGRGLAMVDALATEWGDSGFTSHRAVWFFLAYDLEDSRWSHLHP
ncbi:ATP-binding protein [Nocardiopsis sp. MG754419]|uniref:ATP-binding protein n=1 Tax=Nocardiopsis sp. MG754419 TaxID=2259865 RepID=UPI001BAD925B|nr:ATP-binding protein [Nocardiopsis sp. MG754419]MBR8740817.1 ATP-binding protein [Nocardiopsis sp. MG754419]